MAQRGSAWAFDRNGDVVLANDFSIGRDKHGPFRCHCGNGHIMHLTRPSGNAGRRPFEPYFAHTASGYKRKHSISDVERACFNSGGESKQHLHAKVLLKQRRGHYYFHTHRCRDCRLRQTETLSEACGGEMRLEYRDTETGRIYDCCWVVDGRPKAILEVYHTHACTAAKLDSIRASGVRVLGEFSSKEIVEALQEIPSEPKEIYNRLVDSRWQCPDCVVKAEEKERAEKAVREHIVQFGKYKGSTIKDIFDSWSGPRYVVWLAGYSWNLHILQGKAIIEKDETVRNSDAWRYTNQNHAQTVLAARSYILQKCWICGVAVSACWKVLCTDCFNQEKERAEKVVREQRRKDLAEAARREAERELERRKLEAEYADMRRRQSELEKEEAKLKAEEEKCLQEVRSAFCESKIKSIIAKSITNVRETLAFYRLMLRWQEYMGAGEAEVNWENISKRYVGSDSYFHDMAANTLVIFGGYCGRTIEQIFWCKESFGSEYIAWVAGFRIVQSTGSRNAKVCSADPCYQQSDIWKYIYTEFSETVSAARRFLMKKCWRCGVSVADNQSLCELCSGNYRYFLQDPSAALQARKNVLCGMNTDTVTPTLTLDENVLHRHNVQLCSYYPLSNILRAHLKRRRFRNHWVSMIVNTQIDLCASLRDNRQEANKNALHTAANLAKRHFFQKNWNK